MKTCPKCNRTLPFSEFHKNSKTKDGCHSACKECTRIRDREWHITHRKKRQAIYRNWLSRNRYKRNAQRALKRAVKRGTVIKPTICEVCGDELPKEQIGGHHPNYDRRFDVIWCCQLCHSKLHSTHKICLMV